MLPNKSNQTNDRISPNNQLKSNENCNQNLVTISNDKECSSEGRSFRIPKTAKLTFDNSPIDINVGGQIYTTTLETLTRFPDSRLSKMFNGTIPIVLDPSKQHYFIDRDGDSFRYILNFMRTSTLLLPDNFNDCKILLNEAKYFEINDMVKQIEQFIENKKFNNQAISMQSYECPCHYATAMNSTIVNMASTSKNLNNPIGPSSIDNHKNLIQHENNCRYHPYDLAYDKLIDENDLNILIPNQPSVLSRTDSFDSNDSNKNEDNDDD
jgi:hypothetical protein